MRAVKLLLVTALILLIVIQIIPSGMPQSSEEDERSIKVSLSDDGNVENLLKVSCYDCHSNQTNYPWYSRVAPVSWLLARHIKEGREHLNFSEWEDYETRKKIGLLEDIREEVENGSMPLKGYLVIHKDAKLDKDDVNAISKWAEQSTERLLE